MTRNVHAMKARYVFPALGEPIPEGVVTIEAERIAAVGKEPTGGPVEELGNVAILPGLVNAHTHLEFSELPEPISDPDMGFVDWIGRVTDYRQSQTARRPIEQGLQESVRSGTTALGEIAQPDWPVEQIRRAGVDVTVFLELIAPTTPRVAPALALARQHVEAARGQASWHPGLGPHAPYSVHVELLDRLVEISAAERVPLAFHLAESREELQVLDRGDGPFRDRLEEMGAWDPTAIRPGSRPLDYLHMLAPAHRVLVIHGNYLEEEEIAFLGEHGRQMAVVYCPRTHAHFKHDPYPLEKMLSAGVAVALGTDSRASSPDLSLLAEMRLVAERFPGVGGGVILQLGTIRAAAALGRDRELGSLEAGKYANLAIVALPDRDAADPYELLFDSDRPAVETWYRGEKRL